MQNVTPEERASAEAMERIALALYWGDTPLEDARVQRAEYSAAAGGDGEFAIGTACGATATVTVSGTAHGLEGQFVNLRYRLGHNPPGRTLLHGYVAPPSVGTDTTKIVIEDAIKHLGGLVYAPSDELLEPCGLDSALTDLAHQLGTTLDAETQTAAAAYTLDKGVTDIPKTATLQSAAGLMAGLLGGFAAIGRDGKLTVKTYRDTGEQVGVYAGTSSRQEQAFAVNGILMRRTEVTEESSDYGTTHTETDYEYSAGGNARAAGSLLTMDNPLARQELVDMAWSRMEPMEIYGGNWGVPGGILLEPGDIVDVRTALGPKKAAVTQLRLELDGGCRATVTSAGKPMLANAPRGPITRQLDAMRGGMGGIWGSLNQTIQAAKKTGEELIRVASGLEKIAHVEYDEDGNPIWALADAKVFAALMDETDPNNPVFKEAYMRAGVYRDAAGNIASLAQISADAISALARVIDLEGKVKIDGSLFVSNGIIVADAVSSFRKLLNAVAGIRATDINLTDGIRFNDEDWVYRPVTIPFIRSVSSRAATAAYSVKEGSDWIDYGTVTLGRNQRLYSADGNSRYIITDAGGANYTTDSATIIGRADPATGSTVALAQTELQLEQNFAFDIEED